MVVTQSINQSTFKIKTKVMKKYFFLCTLLLVSTLMYSQSVPKLTLKVATEQGYKSVNVSLQAPNKMFVYDLKGDACFTIFTKQVMMEVNVTDKVLIFSTSNNDAILQGETKFVKELVLNFTDVNSFNFFIQLYKQTQSYK